MHLEYLGDALDHFKGSLFRRLNEAGLIRDLAVDPMATDAEQWTDDDYRLYSELLEVEEERILRSQDTLDKRGRRKLGLPDHQGDLFLDPDTGILTGSQSPARKFVLPGEVGPLLDSSQVLAVYQHAWRANEAEPAREAAKAVRSLDAGIAVAAYTSRQVAMLFFSRDTGRIQAIASWLKCWLGGKQGRIPVL